MWEINYCLTHNFVGDPEESGEEEGEVEDCGENTSDIGLETRKGDGQFRQKNLTER